DRQHALEGRNSPRARWRRAVHYAILLRDNNSMLKDAGIEIETADKQLETQHWLELIDGKHRYGSNCLNYLVTIDNQGKLRWAKNNQPVDTTADTWKDAGEGQGIIPEKMTATQRPQFSDVRRSSANSSVESQLQDNAATHYAGGSTTKKHRWRGRFTLRHAIERLLRKTVQRNTWIYVSVHAYGNPQNFCGCEWKYIYISTTFNVITPLQHFHKFVEVLQQRGVDTSKVRISKAEAALWG
ncbi:hypothetical protein BJ165DRAFT_1350613, partial [Panaeolus papilionaceus]